MIFLLAKEIVCCLGFFVMFWFLFSNYESSISVELFPPVLPTTQMRGNCTNLNTIQFFKSSLWTMRISQEQIDPCNQAEWFSFHTVFLLIWNRSKPTASLLLFQEVLRYYELYGEIHFKKCLHSWYCTHIKDVISLIPNSALCMKKWQQACVFPFSRVLPCNRGRGSSSLERAEKYESVETKQ